MNPEGSIVERMAVVLLVLLLVDLTMMVVVSLQIVWVGLAESREGLFFQCLLFHGKPQCSDLGAPLGWNKKRGRNIHDKENYVA